jgi:RimJ/RimL family protein N-acetyltransferase
MVPLRIKAPDWVRTAEQAPHRSIAFRHATLHSVPGLWGDDPVHPTSAVWFREGDEGTWEAFGAGRSSPAIAWLAARAEGRPIALVAPASWQWPIRLLGGRVEPWSIETWNRPELAWPEIERTRVPVQRLDQSDISAFESSAPPWAARSWFDMATLFEHGAAFGIRRDDRFLCLAWIYESDPDHDKLGIWTAPKFRDLGLGRAVAGALVEHVRVDRRKHPLWVANSTNAASIALARSLGFQFQAIEQGLRWSPPRLFDATARPGDRD